MAGNRYCRAAVPAACCGLAVAAPPPVQAADAQVAAPSDSRENYAYAVGMLAVVYGFPIVSNTTKRYFMDEKPAGVIDVPVNGFFHVPRPANADDKCGASPTPDVY